MSAGARDREHPGRQDWILSHFSLRRAEFDERVEAAASAGFAGVGLFIGEYERLLEAGRSPAELRGVLDRHGVALTEIEVLTGWAQDGPSRAHALHWLERAQEMAAAFGARHLQAVGSYDGTLDDAAAAFARVCDAAAESGLRVALEYVPIYGIADLAAARAIVERAARPNGGLCLDAWHHFRTGEPLASLRALSAEQIVSVQLSDGTLRPESPDYLDDTLRHRRVPGAGEFDLRGFVAAIDATGAQVPRSFEVISSELEGLTAKRAAQAIARAARSVFRG